MLTVDQIVSGHHKDAQVFKHDGLTIVTEPWGEKTVRVTIYRDSDSTVLSQECYGH